MDWLRVRKELVSGRHRLALRAFEEYGRPGVDGAPLLTRPEWRPDRPVPLGDVRLVRGRAPRPELPAPEVPAPYGSYAEALRGLTGAPVRNLPTYRLLAADLRERTLTIGDGWYFDGLETGEAAAHEYAAGRRTLRDAVGDPTDLTRRSANVAISALTLRRAGDGSASMPLHRRDPARVGHAGGMVQVLPVGVFQPPAVDLWDSLTTEYDEELLGAPEDADHGPLKARMAVARPYVLGLGVDPLTFATDLLVAVVIDAGPYDELFGAAVDRNDEGDVLPAVPFTAEQVDRYAAREPTQAAGAAVLRLAWRHRATLLGE